jgi:ABC-type uncharacterized transport system involved in gliding motility auxiliary subunit
LEAKMKAYILLVVGLLLMLSSPWLRQRWDLSEDQRFTLAPSSVSVIQSLDAPIRIKVYLLD